MQSGIVSPLHRHKVIDRSTWDCYSWPVQRPAVSCSVDPQWTVNVHSLWDYNCWRLVELVCNPSSKLKKNITRYWYTLANFTVEFSKHLWDTCSWTVYLGRGTWWSSWGWTLSLMNWCQSMCACQQRYIRWRQALIWRHSPISRISSRRATPATAFCTHTVYEIGTLTRRDVGGQKCSLCITVHAVA